MTHAIATEEVTRRVADAAHRATIAGKDGKQAHYTTFLTRQMWIIYLIGSHAYSPQEAAATEPAPEPVTTEDSCYYFPFPSVAGTDTRFLPDAPGGWPMLAFTVRTDLLPAHLRRPKL